MNNLYEEIAQDAFGMNKFRIPINGIPQAQYENPVNLFQRQLSIE